MVYRKITLPQDRGAWTEIVSKFDCDFYHEAGYVGLCAAGEGGRASLLEIALPHGVILLPLIERPIASAVGWDATSPYGYPGPVVRPSRAVTVPYLIAQAAQDFRQYVKEQGLISVFIRMHPTLTPESRAWLTWGTPVIHGETVSVDLALEPEVRKRQMRGNLRRDIKHLQQAGFIAYDDEHWQCLQDFVEIYNDTMWRVHAATQYFFPYNYFAELREIFGERAHLIVAKKDQEVAAAGLFIRSGRTVQYHLAGSAEKYQRASPMKLVLDFAADYFGATGAEVLHLGGGVNGQNDTLFNFKRGFSPITQPFISLRVVGDREKYTSMCRALNGEANNNTSYFPPYRASRDAHIDAARGVPAPVPIPAGQMFPILVSSAGRRVELLTLLRQDAESLGLRPRLIATDASPRLAPACTIADRTYAVPQVNESGFAEETLAVCEREGVRLMIPTIDPELQALARWNDHFRAQGLVANLSSRSSLKIIQDKAKTAEVLQAAGILAPRTATVEEVLKDSGSWNWPLVAKPIAGSSSIGLAIVADARELKMAAQSRSDLIVQELVKGPEYTINTFVDSNGVCRAAVPHLRREIRAGEVSKAITVRNHDLCDLARRIAEIIPGLFGAICFQAIAGPRGPAVFEINGRFGGGFPVTHRAGGVFTRWLIQIAANLKPSFSDDWLEGVWMLRHDSAIYGQAQDAAGREPWYS
jgi:carbamoyl-phosphate synthase large subunit